ncbi:MAG: hypothetical protein GX916_06680 [Clostridiales bacterium]|nr:hypothetical protein [Clostridiales bacterium]
MKVRQVKFAEAIRTGIHPEPDAYHGSMASNAGMIAWKSAHQTVEG